ncbi:hypothetical protein M1146_05080 [Patescibacteria group bacterium]|nr:hypothetical protein [Patescibacteria group bacterium]
MKDKDGRPLGIVYDELRKMSCKLEAPDGSLVGILFILFLDLRSAEVIF